MKYLWVMIAFVATLTINSAFAGFNYVCNSSAEDSIYVKSHMEIELIDGNTINVQLYDSEFNQWSERSIGTLSKVKENGTAVFKGFNSEDMFGDLSEGAANQGIYLYVSKEVMKGKNSWVTLIARGTEVGLEKATYFCHR